MGETKQRAVDVGLLVCRNDTLLQIVDSMVHMFIVCVGFAAGTAVLTLRNNSTVGCSLHK
jgi:hypothetical protein